MASFIQQNTVSPAWKAIAFLVETDKEPESIKNQAVPFGGAGRHASIEDAGDIEFPKVLPEYPAGRLLLYVATPGILAIWKYPTSA